MELLSWLIIGTVVLVVLFVLSVRGKPLINDITTSFDDPPKFIIDKPNSRYPSRFIENQKRLHPDIKTQQFDVAPTILFNVAKNLCVSRGWEVVKTDESSGRIQAVAITKIMRFRDDVVIRISPGSNPNVSIVDMRSKSRLGRGDLGANAKRIALFFKELREKVQQNK